MKKLIVAFDIRNLDYLNALEINRKTFTVESKFQSDIRLSLNDRLIELILTELGYRIDDDIKQSIEIMELSDFCNRYNYDQINHDGTFIAEINLKLI
jgi:hypothetical protein